MPVNYNDPNFMAKLAFAEADKSSMKNFDEDATAVLHVANTRKNNPNRFGETMEEVFTRSQFDGVGSTEWDKADTKNLTKDEKELYKRALQLQAGVSNGSIKDPTGGADHYANMDISNPNWGNMRTEKEAKNGKFYPVKSETSGHTYFKETNVSKKKKEVVPEEKKLIPSIKGDFGDAFAEARRRKLKEFYYNGQLIAVKLK